jgi:tetratricopeptide (TPR) repeat protein
MWFFCLGLAAGFVVAEEAPHAKDEREYALVQQAVAERDAAKRLQTLETWTAEYADTGLVKLRAQLYLQAYREAGRTPQAIGAAEKLLAIEPGDFAARYTLAALAPVLGDVSADALTRAETSARALLDGGIATQFEASNRPESVSAEAWTNARRESQATSLRTLGWVAMQRKDHAAAETRLKEALQVEPASAQTSYWLAQSVLAQRDAAQNELAFFSLARAASLTGPGELPADSRSKIRAYLEKTYRSFAGTLDGLDELTRRAAASALPSDDMPRILSAEERKALAEKRFCDERPLECAYRALRSALDGTGGAVWTELQGKVTPRMRLYVVGNEPPDRPLALRLAPEEGGRAEVVLRLENRLREALPAGSAVTFEGVASELRRNPFQLTLDQGKIIQ